MGGGKWANPERARALAHQGGTTTRNRYGVDHLREIGAVGGRHSKGVPKKRREIPVKVAGDLRVITVWPLEAVVTELDAV